MNTLNTHTPMNRTLAATDGAAATSQRTFHRNRELSFQLGERRPR
jgi:hypothetical protein